MKKIIVFLLLVFVVCGCSESHKKDNKPQELTDEEKTMLKWAKESVYWDNQLYCQPESRDSHSFLEGFASHCDYQENVNYYVSDPIVIYDVDLEKQSYQPREGVRLFLMMREDEVYSHFMVYGESAKNANDGIELLTQIFSKGENFVMVATGNAAWIVTESNHFLFEENPFEPAELTDNSLRMIREKILGKSSYSFTKHEIDFEEIQAEMERLEKEALEAEQNFSFPSENCLFKELFQDNVNTMILRISSMLGKVNAEVVDQALIDQILNELSEIELTTSFEKVHGAGGESVEMILYSDNGWQLAYLENTNEMTIKASKDSHTMTYAAKNESLREKGLLMPVFERMTKGTEFSLSNGRFDVEFLPLGVKKEGYYVTGELSIYTYPYGSIEGIDFIGMTLYCDGYSCTEPSKESGEHHLHLITEDGEYQLKYFVE